MKPPLFSCLTSRITDNGSLYGRFLLGPLPIDISLTVATVLRRSLLHSQPSFTIVSAEIEGASHEYASLPGIQESVLEILLNLGEIVLTSAQRNFISPNFRTSKGTTPFQLASIRVSGPSIVRAKDINWPKGILCVKPEAYIATLSSNETLAMRIKIACSLSKNQKFFSEIEDELSKSITSVPSPLEDLNQINSSFDFLSESETKENTSASSTTDLTESRDVTEEATLAEQGQTLATSNLNELEFFKLQEINNESTESSDFLETSLFSPLNSQSITIQKENLRLAKQLTYLESYSTRKENLTALLFSGRQDFSEENIPPNSKTNITTSENLKKKNSVTFSVFPEGLTSFNNFVSANTNIEPDENASNALHEDISHELELELNAELSDLEEERSFFNEQSKSFTLFTEKNKRCVELAVSSSSYPVEKVNFLIERDDELAGYRHRIILEVWTNGSISPRQAIFESIGSIIKLIYNFREPLRNNLNNNLFSDTTLA